MGGYNKNPLLPKHQDLHSQPRSSFHRASAMWGQLLRATAPGLATAPGRWCHKGRRPEAHRCGTWVLLVSVPDVMWKHGPGAVWYNLVADVAEWCCCNDVRRFLLPLPDSHVSTGGSMRHFSKRSDSSKEFNKSTISNSCMFGVWSDDSPPKCGPTTQKWLEHRLMQLQGA